MLRTLDIRLVTSGGFMVAVRWIEYCALLLLGTLSLLPVTPLSPLMAIPLLILALVLVPGREATALRREAARMQAIRDLQSEGYELHTRWMDVSDLPPSDEAAQRQWEVRRDTIVWISRSEAKLAEWPEVGGIFAAHAHKQDVMDELDVCLATLSRLRRMLSLSQSLHLPI